MPEPAEPSPIPVRDMDVHREESSAEGKQHAGLPWGQGRGGQRGITGSAIFSSAGQGTDSNLSSFEFLK